MTIPNKVKQAARRLAYHSKHAQAADRIIREWLHSEEMLNDTVVDQLIDAVEHQHNGDAFVQYLTTNEDVCRNGGNAERYKDAY